MLFFNISSDYVHLLDDQDEHFLERNGIENTLGPTLLDYTKSHPVETIFLLPFAVAFSGLSVGAFVAMIVFLLLLVEGLVWAWRKGILTWK